MLDQGDKGIIPNCIESSKISLQPLEIYHNFQWSQDENIFTPPFASENEALGFLSDSENAVLCSKDESLFSSDFVQCSGVLVKNKNTELVSVIHQSVWSASASLILSLQRPDDIDVIPIAGNFGSIIKFSTVDSYHKQDPSKFYESFTSIDRTDEIRYPSKWKNLKHILGDNSKIKGISTNEVEDLFERAEESKNIIGKSRLVGDIKIPVSKTESNRWSLLYRPKENIIWVYESGSKKLFKYPGFPSKSN